MMVLRSIKAVAFTSLPRVLLISLLGGGQSACWIVANVRKFRCLTLIYTLQAVQPRHVFANPPREIVSEIPPAAS